MSSAFVLLFLFKTQIHRHTDTGINHLTSRRRNKCEVKIVKPNISSFLRASGFCRQHKFIKPCIQIILVFFKCVFSFYSNELSLKTKHLIRFVKYKMRLITWCDVFDGCSLTEFGSIVDKEYDLRDLKRYLLVKFDNDDNDSENRMRFGFVTTVFDGSSCAIWFALRLIELPMKNLQMTFFLDLL